MNKLTFSILLVGLFAAVALARTSPQIRRPFRFTPGQTYIYEYRGRQWNGLAKLADQYSGLTLDCDVILQALPEASGSEVLLKLDDIKVEQLHTQALDKNDIRKLNQGREVNQRQLALYKDELSKPIRFTYVDGKIIRFVAQSDDAEWSINIKKSILSLFQLDLAPTKIIKSATTQQVDQATGFPTEEIIANADETPIVYPIYEESFGGICETLYEIDSVDNVEQRNQQDYIEFNDVLNVTKTVNYKNCLTDPSVSYDRHAFKVNTQTIKGKLLNRMQPTVVGTQFFGIPEELKSKYSNAYTTMDGNDNVASPVPVERHSYTKYNISTAPQTLVARRTVPVASPADMSLIEGIYSEGKIKYEADGDVLISDTQQSLKLITCAPTVELIRVAPEIASLTTTTVIRQPTVEYHTIQCELSNQKVKFYQALWKFASIQQAMKSQQQQAFGENNPTSQFYSHKMALPFALSASWYPIVASGEKSAETSMERLVDPEKLGKSYETLLISLADDVIAEDVVDSKKAGEKVVQLINIVSFMPKYKLVEVYDRIVERIQTAKQQQIVSTGKQAVIDNEEVAKNKVARKLCLDSLPLAGSKQAIEMIELLIQSNRVKPFEAKEMCEAVPANLRYPDTELIDAFIRISQLPQVRKSRSLFASCSIAVGKMIGHAIAKSKDASYKPTVNDPSYKLPSHLRDASDMVKQVVEEADPRRQLPINWNTPEQQELYDRLVLDEQDLFKYINLYKNMLYKTNQYHEKIVYLETLAHMKTAKVLTILEPFATGRLSLAQCLGTQPLDTTVQGQKQQQQWYNYRQQQQQQQQRMTTKSRQFGAESYANDYNSKDWNEENSYAAEECNYMRTIAIYAMAHIARQSPAKVQAVLLPVFDNTYEPYQIRIAAFTTLMLTPVEEHILERVASQMWREPSREVASFVVGCIDTMSKMTAPAMQAHRYAAQKAAESMPKQYLDTWKYSWMAGGDHFDKNKQTGLAWVAEIVKSNVSSIPRAAYAHFGRYHGVAGSKFDNHFELGFTSKGLETLLKEYIQYNEQQQGQESNVIASIFKNLYDAKDDIVKYYFEARDAIKSQVLLQDQEQKLTSEPYVQNYFYKRQQPIDGINTHAGKQARKASQMFESSQEQQRQKRSTITFKTRDSNAQDENEEPKLTMFSKIFDSSSYYALDKKQLIQLIEQCDDYVKMAAEELILGGKLHYVKMIMPSNMWHVVPSQLGLPIVVTHRTPIIASIKIDGSPNGQLTSNQVSHYLRQQATGTQVPNVQGQNFAFGAGLNITALVHPKIMHSNYRFMFAVEQSQCEAYGVQVEKSHQLSIPMEVSIAYSQPKQLFSLAIEPKTQLRMLWTKEAAKTFIAPVALATSQPDNKWLGQEHLIRVPSKQSQYKRIHRPELFVPSLLASIQQLINEPKEQQIEKINELETPYKFEHVFIQKLMNLQFHLEGVSDDEDVIRQIGKSEMGKQTRGQLEWSNVEQVEDLDQHSKSGPMGEYLHVLDSAINRPSKYLEFYTTLKPNEQNKSPVYRFDFILSSSNDDATIKSPIKFNSYYKNSMSPMLANITPNTRRSSSINRLDLQSPGVWEQQIVEQQQIKKQLNSIHQQPAMLEVY